jgi:hypothetical protein
LQTAYSRCRVGAELVQRWCRGAEVGGRCNKSRCRGLEVQIWRMEVQMCMCSGFAVVPLSRCRGPAEVIGDCSGAEQVYWCRAGAVQRWCKTGAEQMQKFRC